MLRRLIFALLTVALFAVPAPAQTPPAKQSPPAKAPAKVQSAPAKPPTAAKKEPDPEAELERAIEDAGNDRAALVRNLEDYLKRFPDPPRKVAIYRALVESAVQIRDNAKALDYAERVIALRPDDPSMMLFAVDLLENAGGDASLTRAVGYATRVLDRVEKATAEAKPARVSQAEWESEQKKLRMSVYLIRGRLQMKRKKYDEATNDLEMSYRLLPNAAAALHLGEIEELEKARDKAIEHYVAAFVLPDQEGLAVDRWEVRRKLGNLWQLTHGSEAGLGERLLQAYDKMNADPKTSATPEYNKGARDPFEFVLRRTGKEPAPVKLAESKGKVMVLKFWATWCLPCRELQPLLDRVEQQFESKGDVVFFALNTDEDENRVAPFLEREKMRGTVAFADGLDRLLKIRGLPTVIVLDRAGKIVYRAEGFAPDGFAEALTAAIEKALSGAS